MQQRLRPRRRREIIGNRKEVEVSRDEHLGHGGAAQLRKVTGEHQEISQQQTGRHRYRCRWHDPSNSTLPEIPQRKRSCLKLAGNQRRDQITGNYEKDIHSHVSTGKLQVGVKKYDRQDRERAKAVDFGSVGECSHRFTHFFENSCASRGRIELSISRGFRIPRTSVSLRAEAPAS
jgi:hypothetical protein